MPLSKRIQPETWLNIPVCIVKAFQSEIENHEYLEKKLIKINHHSTLIDNKIILRSKNTEIEFNKKLIEIRNQLTQFAHNLDSQIDSNSFKIEENIKK